MDWCFRSVTQRIVYFSGLHYQQNGTAFGSTQRLAANGDSGLSHALDNGIADLLAKGFPFGIAEHIGATDEPGGQLSRFGLQKTDRLPDGVNGVAVRFRGGGWCDSGEHDMGQCATMTRRIVQDNCDAGTQCVRVEDFIRPAEANLPGFDLDDGV